MVGPRRSHDRAASVLRSGRSRPTAQLFPGAERSRLMSADRYACPEEDEARSPGPVTCLRGSEHQPHC
ncbi:hypothetical protein NDU88_005051, partial [Pleurodeles waltl]